MSADWRARRTVAFHLSMDTINTWWDELSWNAKTTIQRQHGDRFDKFLTNGSKTRLIRKIDYYNEGINPILNHNKGSELLRSEVLPDTVLNWYLIYKTKDSLSPDDTTNPVSAMLLTDQSLLVERSAGTPDIYEYYISSICPDHTIV